MNWDGPRVRDLFQRSTRDMLKLMEQFHADQAYEVQILVARIRDLVLASLNPHNPAGLRGPLNALVNVLATHAPVFITSPYNYQMYLFGRVFAIAAMNVVDPREQSAAPNMNVVDHDFEDLIPNVPTDAAPSPILQNPTGKLVLANEEVRPVRMSAKRKLVFDEEESPISPKHMLVVPKEEDTPSVPRRRSSRKSRVAVVDESVADSPRFHPIEVKKEVDEVNVADENSDVDANTEKKKCDHCDMDVAVSETEQFKHAWKKHKNLVYKYIRRELVCTVDYCDYVSSSVHTRKIHVGRTHGATSVKLPSQKGVVSELQASKCPYCAADIDSIVSLKKHMLKCTERDERPMLGCSSCPKQTFHFIYDFTVHLKKSGGVTHGNPTLLSYK